MSKFCRNCGSVLDDNAAFCNKCGARIDSAPGAPGTPGGGPTPPPYGSGFGSNFPPAANGGLSSNEAIFNMGILIAGILVIISTLLPYVTIKLWGYSESISLLLGEGDEFRDGVFFIILTIGAVVCTFLSQRLPAMILGIINFLLCIFEIVNTNSTVSGSGVSSMVKYGPGFYLIFIASLAMGVLAIVNYVNSTKSKPVMPF